MAPRAATPPQLPGRGALPSRDDLSVYRWVRAWLEERATKPLQLPRPVTGHDPITLGLRLGLAFQDILEAALRTGRQGQPCRGNDSVPVAGRG